MLTPKRKAELKRILGVTFIVLGIISILTPLTPFGWLVLIGLELLGVRIRLWRKIKSLFQRGDK